MNTEANMRSTDTLSQSEVNELALLTADILSKALTDKPSLTREEVQTLVDNCAAMYSLALSLRFPARKVRVN